jgi:hypothetical protein
MAEIVTGDGERRFEFGLDPLIDGLAARLPRPGTSVQRQR